MSDVLIELAIRKTTGPGDEKPYLFRVLSWLSANYDITNGDAFTVAMYLVKRDLPYIVVGDYPRSGMH